MDGSMKHTETLSLPLEAEVRFSGKRKHMPEI